MLFQYNLLIVVSIIFVDLTLSGDNILAISTVALLIPAYQRRFALFLSAIGATGLRLCLTLIITSLFVIPLFQLIGGFIILLIIILLLKEQSQEMLLSLQKLPQSQITEERHYGRRLLQWLLVAQPVVLLIENKFLKVQSKFLLGVATLVLVDTMTSLDNAVALGAMRVTTRISTLILVVGLILSKVILYLGSVVIIELLKRILWFVFLACILLSVVAGYLINSAIHQVLSMVFVHSHFLFQPVQWLIYGLCGMVVVVSILQHYRQNQLKINS